MRRVFEITITGVLILDDIDGEPDDWPTRHLCQEMQGIKVETEEMQVIQKAPSLHEGFGPLPPDRSVADKTMHLLECAGSTGMTRTQIRNQFARHKSSAELSQVLGTLAELGHARMERMPTGGRPEERWFACMGES